jgi:hypothetical protein
MKALDNHTITLGWTFVYIRKLGKICDSQLLRQHDWTVCCLDGRVKSGTSKNEQTFLSGELKSFAQEARAKRDTKS